MRLSSIRVRLFASMVAISVAFVLGSAIAMTWLTNRMAEAEVSKGLSIGLNAYRRFQTLQTDLAMSRAWSVAETPFLKAVLAIPGLDHETAFGAVRDLSGLMSDGRLLLISSDGLLLGDGARPDAFGDDFAAHPGIQDVLVGDDYVGVWVFEGLYHRVALTPVIAGSVLLGAVAVADVIDDEAVEALYQLTGHEIVISSPDGVIGRSAALGSPGGIGSGQARSDLSKPLAGTGDGPPARLELDGREWLASGSTIEGSDVQVLLLRALDDFDDELASLQPWILRAGLAGVLLAALIGLWLAAVVSSPLLKLRDAVVDVGQGRLERRVDISSNDEVGELGQAFNHMASELLRRTEELTRAKDEAEALSRAKSDFLANMSHEIRTPLNGVLATASILREGALDERQARQVNRILQSGDLLLALVNDILDLAKVEAHQLTLAEDTFSLHDKILEVVELQRAGARNKGIDIEVQMDGGFDDIQGDAVRVYQVLSNLIGNAVKFTTNGVVKVACALETDRENDVWVVASVEDTGIGIAADRIVEIFGKFTQADASTTRRFGGTGLGLAICDRLVKLMGGEIRCESTVGVGSTFWVRLPYRPAQPSIGDAPDAVPLESEPDEVQPAGVRVLLVEDNPINQEVAGEMLTHLGYEFDLAENGVEAIAILNEQRHGVVLMDCEMPEMDGLEATREIRKNQVYHIPIIGLSAHESRVGLERCTEAGMDAYLSKPVQMQRLGRELRKWTGTGAPRPRSETPV